MPLLNITTQSAGKWPTGCLTSAEFAAAHDLIFFVCGQKAQTERSYIRECKKINPNSYLIDQPEEIDRNLLEDVHSIGICGATFHPQMVDGRM